MADRTRPFRYTKGKLSYETTLLIIFGGWLWVLVRWGFRRLKPIAYHPWGIAGLLVVFGSYIVTPWATVVIFWAVLVWQRGWPYSYQRHAHWRVQSFFAGFRYRHRPRRRLSACGLINDKDSIPTVSYVRKVGCTTKIRIKMSPGDHIDYWRDEGRPARLAQTYNAADCNVNPLRKNNFLTFRPDQFLLKPPFIRYHFKEKVTKYRWLELEFLTKDPFASPIGFEYIDFHRTTGPLQEVGRPIGPRRDGSPYCIKTRTHLLVVAMSGRGKSNAERAMVYAEYPDVLDGYVENWIFDGKRGTEAKPMEHCFARREYGQDGPLVVERFFGDLERVLYRRLDAIGEAGENLFIPDPHHPNPMLRRLLRFYIDELMILESVPYADVKNRIYKSIAAVQQQGRAAGVSIRAFAQNPKLDRLPLRDDFPEIWIGGLQNRRQIDTALAGGWELGAREIPEDLPGIFYVKTEVGMALEQFRCAHDRDNAIKRLPKCPESVLWPGPEEVQRDISGVLIA